MSARATLPVASPAPDPGPAGAAVPPRVGLILGIVRRLVAYGTHLLQTLQQGSAAGDRALAAMTFGTKDLALIIARIKCGLLRAATLEARLQGYVARGCDLPVPAARSASSGARKTAGRAAPVPARAWFLEALPTAEEIAVQVRTRSLGVVIGDICRELGLAAGMIDGGLWQQMMQAVGDCGIDLCAFIAGRGEPKLILIDAADEAVLAAWRPAEVDVGAGAARGPP